ncbi:C-type lectin domain family 9 member A-like [Haliotis cracherodii]|uniref:C-type lectin domain family 9 member A-like n=1 Tax=Haliotis cracherodii TaxID=6455 RepID=UPI0039EBD43E
MNELLHVCYIFLSAAFAMNTASRHLFSRVTTLDDLKADEVSTNQSGSKLDCVALCSKDALCVAATSCQDECFIYRSSVSSTETTTAGARTFIKQWALPTPDPCPVSQGYTSVMSPRLCYKLSDVRMNWTESRALCQSAGGRLMILNTDENYDYMLSYIQLKSVFAWIGLEMWGESSYAWTDGSTHIKEEAKSHARFHKGYNACGILNAWEIRSNKCVKARYHLCEIPV